MQLASSFVHTDVSFVQSSRHGNIRKFKQKKQTTQSLWNFFGDDDAAKDTISTSKIRPYHNDVKVPPQLPVILEDTFLANKELKCCYQASVDGFDAYTFHQCSDFRGPCIVLGITKTGFRFGGFNPLGFRSTDDYYETFKAFLFYFLPDETCSPVILPKVGGCEAAVFDYARGGPQFGPDGLLIGPPVIPVMGGFSGPDPNRGEGDLRTAKSRLGLSYARRPDGKDSIFGDEKKAKLVEVEIFACPALASMY